MKRALLALTLGMAVFLAAWLGTTPPPVASCVLVYNASGHGSGAIVDANCVLTARHVADEPNLVIRTHDGDEHRVVRVVNDPDSDLALLYIDGTFDERPLLFDPAPLRVGDEIVLVGAPFDTALQNCVLAGRVVKVDAKAKYNYPVDAANIDILDCRGGPGCSGGPVFDRRGRIRAVVTMGFGPLCGAVPVAELNP